MGIIEDAAVEFEREHAAAREFTLGRVNASQASTQAIDRLSAEFAEFATRNQFPTEAVIGIPEAKAGWHVHLRSAEFPAGIFLIVLENGRHIHGKKAVDAAPTAGTQPRESWVQSPWRDEHNRWFPVDEIELSFKQAVKRYLAKI